MNNKQFHMDVSFQLTGAATVTYFSLVLLLPIAIVNPNLG
jgi:hypothetical protein